MMNLLELLPKNDVEETAKILLKKWPFISGVNIPDILRYKKRSHEIAFNLLSKGVFVVPHIRVCDRKLSESVELISKLVDAGLTDVLLVSGDRYCDRQSEDVSVIDLLSTLRSCRAYDDLKIYTALDPYRSPLLEELGYCYEKINAGSNGMFTQPFFCKNLAKFFLEQLSDFTTLFIGIAPVLTDSSKAYWLKVNKAIFPSKFSCSFDDNERLLHSLLSLAKEFNQHTYSMPIKMDYNQFLSMF